MLSNKTYLYEFGDFTLNTEEKVLRRDGEPFGITPKALEMLCVLVKDHGRIVEKEKLMNEVWAGSFVEESNITFTIRQLRKLLGDNAQNPLYIETVPKRGYRFIAEIRRVGKGNEETAKENPFDGSPLDGDPATPAKFTQPEKSGAGAIVALADWQHAGDENPAESVVSKTLNGQNQKPELNLPEAFVKNIRSFYLIVLAGLICLVAAAGIGYAFYRSINFFGENPAVYSVRNMTRLTSGGNAKFASVAPDGKFIVYVVEENKRQSLWLKNTANGSTIEILPPAEQVFITSVTFSPDGNHIYYGMNNTLYQLPVLGGTAKKILPNFHGGGQVNQISFSPDGSQFTFIRYTSEETSDIVITNTDGTNERVLASSKRPAIFLRSAAWSPDGKYIACAALNSAGSQQVINVSISDGTIAPVSPAEWEAVRQVVWRPDGSGFFVIITDSKSISQIWSLDYPSGEARNITNDTNDYQTISLTADASSIVAVRAEQEAHLWVTSAEDVSRIKQLTSGFEKFDGVWGMTWTTGGKIIFETSPSGQQEIWKIDADGSNLSQIATEAGAMSASPDGRYLVYQSSDGKGNGSLFRLNMIDGEKKRLTNGTDIDPTFSPDGKWVVFTRYAEDVALWKVPVDGSREAVKLTNFSGYSMFPSVSPDGRFIAFYRGSAESPLPISIISIDGGEIVKSFKGSLRQPPGNGKIALHWTVDGQALDYVIHNDEGVSNIWRQKFDGSAPVQITNFSTGLIFNFAVSSDGKRFALSRGTFSRDVIVIKVKR